MKQELEKLNQELNSKITTIVEFDEMYQKTGIVFFNEKKEAFFKAFGPGAFDDDEDWKINTFMFLKNRYLELYKK